MKETYIVDEFNGCLSAIANEAEKSYKGYAHLKSGCVNKKRIPEKSYITFSESDYDKDDLVTEDMINMVTNLGIVKEGNESDSKKNQVYMWRMKLVENLLKLQDENKSLRENLAKLQEDHMIVIQE
ncbi:unnamed protein product [Cochlearia groenlandica]